MPKKFDAAGLYGRMTVTVYDEGVKVYRCVKMNQITDKGRESVLELLAQILPAAIPPAVGIPQANPTYNKIWSLSVGEDPTPPASTQIALLSPVWTSALDIPAERQYIPSLFEIYVHKEIPAGTATGAVLAEAGIFTRGSLDEPAPGDAWETIQHRRMYARQIFPAITKGATMSIVFDWHLGMTIQA